MARILGSPLSLLLAGWIWLLLSTLLGWATFLGIVRGAPLPYGFRLLHVHGALVGGLLQLLLGLALTVVELSGPDSKRPKQPGLFLGLNLAVLALAVGTWLRQPNLTLPAGLGLLFLFAPVTRRLFLALATRPDRTPLVTFFFGFACARCSALSDSARTASSIASFTTSSKRDMWAPAWRGLRST